MSLENKVAAVCIMYAMENDLDPKIVNDYAMMLVESNPNGFDRLLLFSGVKIASAPSVYQAFVNMYYSNNPNCIRDLWNRLKKADLVR
jgi:hypothetical protein